MLFRSFYINADVVLQPQGTGRVVPAFAPPPEGQPEAASPVPVSLAAVTINGVLHTAGMLQVDREVRIFGAIVAERGLAGAGLLEVWYNNNLGRGRVPGLPVVFPIRGTWREQ